MVFFFNDTASTEIYTLSLHDALPIFRRWKIAEVSESKDLLAMDIKKLPNGTKTYEISKLLDRNFLAQHYLIPRSEEHTSELQSRLHLVCRLLLEKKKKTIINYYTTIA